MSWTQQEIASLKALAGVFRLPGGCWAVLSVNDAVAPSQSGVPEGVGYAWVILMPGTEGRMRGDRMAGVDNADDAIVRNKILADPASKKHRAHRHWPDWKRVREVNGMEWPLAGKGVQLEKPPGNPVELWRECMACLRDVFDGLGLPMPTESVIMQGRVTEEDFRRMQQMTSPSAKKSSAP